MKITPTFASITLAAILIASPNATANGTGQDHWEWDTELQDRQWRQETLNWAAAIHPASPSITLVSLTTPPPREMYCAYNTVPTVNDCDTHEALLEDWLHDFLELGANEPVNIDDVLSFPEECVTICAQ